MKVVLWIWLKIKTILSPRYTCTGYFPEIFIILKNNRPTLSVYCPPRSWPVVVVVAEEKRKLRQGTGLENSLFLSLQAL